ncbi:hypothetical protein E3N88_30334 [Mikania micrantha]|uniref:galactinol--sucrose galactosyltransferase n=1 Tax=Mikania micrantha TaxID=192012 RepID=A0A5N6MLI3_9ASTR|nr:hypothetical protein E3N88_30334 [Mikania micrantha]
MAPTLFEIEPDDVKVTGGGNSTPMVTLVGSNFMANGHAILSDVPSNITTCLANSSGCFVGFDALEPNCHHVVPIGKLSGIRFMSIFRFKVWWTTHWVGSNGRDLEHETQMVMLENSDSGRPYVLILPILEGSFRASLQPGKNDFVDVCVESGCPPGLVLLDDGWQSISHDDDPIDSEGMNRTAAGEQMPCRLTNFVENYKFRDYVSSKPDTPNKGLGAFVRDLKQDFESVDYVYVWHALCGYWGGLRPNIPGLPESRIVKPILSPGLEKTMEDLAVDKIVNNKVGLVPPEKVDQLYEGLHKHLESVGIDGVKVDVIHLLEMLCEDYGGRIELAKAYYRALTSSVRNHFKGNGVIASMEHCNDFMYLGTEAIALGRVGDDFWCTDPSGDPNGTFWLQGCHMVHCAYNSLWMGNFIQPDWDMFQSTHPCAEFHAASRAISGGPIYVSDSVGKHNFDLLKSLVLPDGSILRCQYYALPTRDCLFENPLHDGKTMLKIWNLNKYTGVVGAFNCQGGGWSRESRRMKSASDCSHVVTSTICPNDVEWQNGKYPIFVGGVQAFALYMFHEKKLILAKPTDNIELALEPFTYELVTVSPITVLAQKSVQFAPIGLVNMLNSGGAIQSVEFELDVDGASMVRVGVKGAGEMRVFASEKPGECRVNGENADFKYEEHMVIVQVPWIATSLSNVEFVF